MGQHGYKRQPAARKVDLWVASVSMSEGGLMNTTLYRYPRGAVEAVHPMLAWAGVWDGPSLPVVARELVSLHQALVEVIADDSRQR